MRKLALVILLCWPVLALAQAATDMPPQQAQQSPPAVSDSSSNTAPGHPLEGAGPAPQLGHPLDPHDVTVLTGQDKAQRLPAAAYSGYYGYPVSGGPLSTLDGGPYGNSTWGWSFGTGNGAPFLFHGNWGHVHRTPFFGPLFTPFFPVGQIFTFNGFSRSSASGSAMRFGAVRK
jgi:hypothetical protein